MSSTLHHLKELERRLTTLERGLERLLAGRRTDYIWSHLLPGYLSIMRQHPDRPLPDFIDLVFRVLPDINPEMIRLRLREEEKDAKRQFRHMNQLKREYTKLKKRSSRARFARDNGLIVTDIIHQEAEVSESSWHGEPLQT